MLKLKAHSLLYHSTQGSRVIKKREEEGLHLLAANTMQAFPRTKPARISYRPHSPGFNFYKSMNQQPLGSKKLLHHWVVLEIVRVCVVNSVAPKVINLNLRKRCASTTQRRFKPS